MEKQLIKFAFVLLLCVTAHIYLKNMNCNEMFNKCYQVNSKIVGTLPKSLFTYPLSSYAKIIVNQTGSRRELTVGEEMMGGLMIFSAFVLVFGMFLYDPKEESKLKDIFDKVVLGITAYYILMVIVWLISKPRLLI